MLFGRLFHQLGPDKRKPVFNGDQKSSFIMTKALVKTQHTA